MRNESNAMKLQERIDSTRFAIVFAYQCKVGDSFHFIKGGLSDNELLKRKKNYYLFNSIYAPTFST